MIRTTLTSFTAAALTLSLCVAGLQAGGRLETYRLTGLPSPIAGHQLADVIGIEWDTRALPVRYVVNTTSTPGGFVPNPLGAPVLSLADATAAFQASLDQWNAIPTSFIELHVTGTVAKPVLRGFDMINELTFGTPASFGAIASSPSVSLIADVTLLDGDDIDGDGDSDVSSAITTAADVDADGDIEFPAGAYPAGTILDNDVQFNTKASNGLRFTVGDAALDTVASSVDLNTVAIHEFGHSFGLSHVLNNNKSPSNGRSAVMFPFIDTGDPEAERIGRDLDSDDIAMTSLIYPEGTATSGPAALQAGDVAFSKVYGLVTGAVRHGVLNQPLAGASVYAIDRNSGDLVATAFSGTTRLSVSPTGGLFFVPTVADAIVDGNYEMALPKGTYVVGIEAVDGNPAAVGNISFTTQIGGFFGQQSFNEEFYNGNKEDVLEKRPGDGKAFTVNPGKVRSGIDITTNRVTNINNFGNRNFVGFTAQPPGSAYAVRIPAAQVLAAVAAWSDFTVPSAEFDTSIADASVVPLFADAMLTTGSVAGSQAFIDLNNPLFRSVTFVAADNDFAPMFVKNPHDLAQKIKAGIASGQITDLFLVLRLPRIGPFPGVSALPPFIGLDGGVANNDAPIFGYSYTSLDGTTFNQSTTFNFRFSLSVAEAVP